MAIELETTLDLKEVVKHPNLAELLSESDLAKLGKEVWEGWDIDRQSREPWEQKTKMALDLALQVAESKTFPWQGASNVKFPLVTIAAMQFHARAYPALLPGPDVVKCSVVGSDPDQSKSERAKRVADHMSFQILEEDEDWEEHMDKALLHQAIVGCAFKKTYFNPSLGHNVSEHVLAKDLYVSYYASSLDKAPRITQVLFFSENDLYERFNRGVFLDWNRDARPQITANTVLEEAKDNSQGTVKPGDDPATPYRILEQHTWIDLDGDGYKEPYIVYLREDNRLVLRIVARFKSASIEYGKNKQVVSILADQYFTKFSFVPSPDGGFYDLGFGALLGPLNESINTSVNQLIDAGTLSNTAGGFLGRGVKFRSGDNSFKPFEWKRVDSTGDDLRKGVFPLPVREPSPVLFNLLSLLIDYGERIGMAVDPLVGKNPGQNTPAETSRNMIAEGQRIFNAIFKRTYRGLKEEFRKWYKLNSFFLEDQSQYFSINFGQERTVLRQDYYENPKTIVPAADPNMVSDEHKLVQAQLLKQAAMQTQGYDKYEVEKIYLKALRIQDIEKIFPDPKGKDAIKPQPHPKVMVEMMKNQVKQLDIQLKSKLAQAKLMEEAEVNRAKIAKLEAEAVKIRAEAQAVGDNTKIAAMDAMIGAAKSRQDGLLKAMDILMSIEKDTQGGKDSGGAGGVPPVGAEPSNAGVPAIPEEFAAGV